MSQSDEIKPEYKTIRITAGTYYKLVELTGLLSAVAGENFSLSQIADLLLIACHGTAHPQLLATIKDPKLVEQYRENLKKELFPMLQLFKDVKIKK